MRKPRTPRRRNSTRDREVAEIKMLRSLARELETHVISLSRGSKLPLRVVLSSASTWQCLAERQARERKKAEATNRQLIDRAQNNADWIQRLWELLHKTRLDAEVDELKKMTVLCHQAGDNFMMQHLKVEMQALGPLFLQAFESNGIAASCVLGQERPTETLADVWSSRKSSDVESALVCVRRIPFDVHSTSAAVWTALSRPEKSYASSSSDFNIAVKALERAPSECCLKGQYAVAVDNKVGIIDSFAFAQKLSMSELMKDRLAPEAPDDNANQVIVWRSAYTLDSTNERHSDTMWISIVRSPSHPLESIVSLITHSRIDFKPSEQACRYQEANMRVVEGCVGSILLGAENLLLGDSFCSTPKPARHEKTPITSIDL